MAKEIIHDVFMYVLCLSVPGRMLDIFSYFDL